MDRTRREFLKAAAAASAGCAVQSALPTDPIRAAEPEIGARLASGVKVGEVTDRSAIVWTRLTQSQGRSQGPRVEGAAKGDAPEPLPAPVDRLEGACPGAPGSIRVRYAVAGEKPMFLETAWETAEAKNDFVRLFFLKSLEPATRYVYEIETADPDGTRHGTLTGTFRTAPRADAESDVRMAFINCQKFHTREREDGFHVYEHIQKSDPEFVVFTGDNVYYDSDQPRAVTAEIARYHWQRSYSLPRHANLLRSCGSYWIKDDHDTHSDDVFPGRAKSIMGKFTFDEGLGIYRQQVRHMTLGTPAVAAGIAADSWMA